MSLKQLIFPRSIAFVGGNECEIAIRRTMELGFTGKIHAIHPKRDQLAGIATSAPSPRSVNRSMQPLWQ